MSLQISLDRLRFLSNRLRERLWVRPLAVSLLSIAAVFLARLADDSNLARFLPAISGEATTTLLSIMASGMLVIATFSVGAMVSAYSSASRTATPRSLSLVMADDVSQNALSTFVGAFIFSILALMAVKNDYFAEAGYLVLFAVTIAVFAVVIVVFVRWVDRIARLGRMTSTIRKVERAAAGALRRRAREPTLRAVPADGSRVTGCPVYTAQVGYVQHVDVAALQSGAERIDAKVVVAVLPGAFVTPDRALAYVCTSAPATASATEQADSESGESGYRWAVDAFQLGNERLFENDPRFGLIVLSEIASRALSPAVNDPGTAIDIIGTLVRLFADWHAAREEAESGEPECDRVEVPRLLVRDLFDDAFTAIGRDGAGTIEVSLRLQKGLHALASLEDAAMQTAARYHGRLALERSERALDCAHDLEAVRAAARFAQSASG